MEDTQQSENSNEGIFMSKHLIKYTAMIKELNDGQTIEVDGHLTGLTTELTSDGRLKVGGLIRDIKGEVI